MGLTVLHTEDGDSSNEVGTVEFKALYIENGELSQIHEKSLFQRENEKWVYVSGVMLD